MSQRYWNPKVILLKIESSYGVNAAPVGSLDGVLATQVKLMPMQGQDVQRELERPFHAADPTLPADLHAKLSFRVELAPSGTPGLAPAWGPALRACGVAQTIVAGTSVTYNSISSGHESVSIQFFVDGVRFGILGARGNFKMLIEASGIPYLEFSFTGRYAAALDSPLPAVTLSAFKDPVVAGADNTPTFTLDGVAMVARSFSFDAGVQVEPRFLIGRNDIIISGCSEKIEMTVEARLMALWNPYTRAQAAARIPIVLQHGTVAGARTTLNVPLAQMMRPGDIGQTQNIVEWPLSFIPQPNLGNDQWTLVLT